MGRSLAPQLRAVLDRPELRDVIKGYVEYLARQAMDVGGLAEAADVRVYPARLAAD